MTNAVLISGNLNFAQRYRTRLNKMASSSFQSGPWSIPMRYSDDLSTARPGARPASYVAGSFFSPVSGVYAGTGVYDLYSSET